jgi:hypothetical protein
MSEPRVRVRQVPRNELRSPSPPGSRLRFVEYAPGGEEAATYRRAQRVATRGRLSARRLLAPLLPAGYPDSVTSDYLPFQVRAPHVNAERTR